MILLILLNSIKWWYFFQTFGRSGKASSWTQPTHYGCPNKQQGVITWTSIYHRKGCVCEYFRWASVLYMYYIQVNAASANINIYIFFHIYIPIFPYDHLKPRSLFIRRCNILLILNTDINNHKLPLYLFIYLITDTLILWMFPYLFIPYQYLHRGSTWLLGLPVTYHLFRIVKFVMILSVKWPVLKMVEGNLSNA